jgi:diguanylate cyclase
VDPLAVTAGLGTLAGLGTGWHLLHRARRSEAEAARLRRRLQAAHHAASHDPLTGLPNRRAFYQLGAALMADSSRHPLAVALLDLDDFKRVNDGHGHAAGDRVLITVAARLATCFGDNLIARIGGDEFAGLLCVPDTAQRTLDRAATALAAIAAEPIQLGANGVTAVTASAGLVPVSPDGQLAEALHRADVAMYRAKAAYRARSGGAAILRDTSTSRLVDNTPLAEAGG